jgi:hypothetical protein
VVPLLHLLAICLFQQSPPHERPQDAAADLGLHRLGVVRIEFLLFDEVCALLQVGFENAVDKDDMEMRVFRVDYDYISGLCNGCPFICATSISNTIRPNPAAISGLPRI